MTINILDEIKRDYVRDLAMHGGRTDGRAMDAFRPISVEPGVITSAEGSARVKLGKSQVIAGIKLGVGSPFPDRPKEGVLSTNAEFLPLASPSFESGPPSELSIELARVVDRGIRSANAVDIASLLIDEDTEGKSKVWAVYIDLYVLDHDGNLQDAAGLAAMSAILNVQMPKYEDGKLTLEEKTGPLPSQATAVSCTFGKIGNAILVDPSYEEEVSLDARITMATIPGHICACQKTGMGSFKLEEIDSCMQIALKKGDELRALLKQ
ncbi:MAG: exosome complex protein Rrp42 [Candidatus Burarchaeum sp.]|nr:exosome complex protein Rrp42 [Candidatus Burarchaeum sp.]MDO8339542.1 exosome complex protein Rrp42 [Candidatus Burarchaeum sp.]